MDFLTTLHENFGHRQFRAGQEEVVRAITEGRDVLVVMPTGGGKSLCYQLPALLMDGVTLVISPLIALMKDQVETLEALGVPVAFINSTLSPAEQSERIQGITEGRYKLLYIAPERFKHRQFVEALGRVKIAFVAVDEAHCVSMWGHDFRPDYLRVGQALQRLPQNPRVAAFTATATPEVRGDIIKHLSLTDPLRFASGFARPNLKFGVRLLSKNAEKYARLGKVIERHGTGIIYCATRKRVDEVAERLADWDLAYVAYHGGMDEESRNRAQDAFMSRKADVAVATNAFGMGIDRSDIRFVCHFEMPGSVEAYYQEAGRAGRDGEPAACELFFRYSDTRVQEFFIEGSNPSPQLIHEIYRFLRNNVNADNEVVMPISVIAEEAGAKNDMAVGAALAILGRHNYIERFDVPGSRARGTRVLRPEIPPESIEIDLAAMEEKERRDRAKLQSVLDYAESGGCRQVWMRRYFGEDEVEDCKGCDACTGGETDDLRDGSEEEKLILRKALSGVARMSWRDGPDAFRGRWGKGMIVQMLVGSRSKRLLDAELDKLTTYGLLFPQGSAYVNALFSEIELRGLVKTVKEGFDPAKSFPKLTLTERGVRAMRDEITVRLEWPLQSGTAASGKGKGASGKAASSGSNSPALSESDEDLLKKLKKKRLQLSMARKVPPYVIFSNRTLEHLAAHRPASIEAAMDLPGIGEVSAKKYLPAFLELLTGSAMLDETG